MPPLAGPRAVQVSRTLAALGGMGWRSTVVCVEPRPGGPLLRDTPGAESFSAAGVDLIRVPSPEEALPYRAAFRLLPILARLPDRQRAWAAAAARAAARRLDAGGIDVIVSFALPWSDHLVGLRLHRARRLPWVAHFSDPWVDSPYLTAPAWLRARWARMEADVIREADALVFITGQTADAVMRKYPAAWRHKAHVIPQGYRRTAIEPVIGDPRTRPERLRIVYAGRFYEGMRTPGPLFEAIARLRANGRLGDEIELLLVGPHMAPYHESVRRLGLESVVSFAGRKSYSDARRAAAGADVLLVVDAPSETPSLFLPSKLIDYLPLRKPILGLTPPAGASADLLRRLGCPIVGPGDVEGIGRAIEQLVVEWRGGGLQVSDVFDAVASEFDIERTTARLADVLGRCV